ncbi:MAG: helix-turn-helix domain-containing protein [Stellaceae bacterium]
MKKASKKTRLITKVQQGQIIQRVLVDGWSPAETAAAFGLEVRLVKTWVADYRRHGLASLHRPPSRSLATEIFRRKLAWPLAAALHRMRGAVRRTFIREPVVAVPSLLHQDHDDRRDGNVR